MQSEALFEAALGASPPWYMLGRSFDAEARTLTICVNRPGSEQSWR